MKNRTQKFLIFAITLIIASALSILAGAEDSTVYSSGGLNYTLNEDMTATITGFSGEASDSLVIPETIDGYAVKAIGKKAFYSSKITSLTLPEGLERLESASFQSCNRLTEIVIPESVSFAAGSKATEFAPFYLSTNIKKVIFSGTRNTIPNYICHQVTNLEEIVWPEGVTEIGSHAFAYCDGLRTLEIPDGVTTLGQGAFSNCDGLTEIIIPQSVNNVSGSTGPFEYSNKVKTVIFKGKRTEIPAYLCHRLQELEKIEGCGGFEGLEGLESIGSHAFTYCKNLKSFRCPSTLKSIGKYSFSYCTALTDIDFANIETIASDAFYGCTALKSVTLPKTLQENKEVITQGPFYGCSGITSMIFEGTTIPTRFCNNVKSLYAVDMINGLEYTGSSAFTGTDVGVFVIRNKVCSIPDSEKSIPDTAEIYSYSGSTAEAYAKKYNRVFHPLETMNNVDGAARYIRERMLQKDNYIIFNADLSIEKAGFRTLMNKVFEYDPKNPETGDYLRWNISSYHPTVTETDGKLFCTIEVNYFTTKEQDEELNAVIPEIVTKLGDNDYEKIHSIFELLCDNSKEGVSYKTGKDIYHSAYSVLVNKTGNCQGLALAFNRLSLEAGIESRIVVNTQLEHAWNIVRLDGNWYYVDVTSAKSDAENEVLYFLRSSLTAMTLNGETPYLPEYEEDYPETETELSKRRTPFGRNEYVISDTNYCAEGECNHVYTLTSIEGYQCKGNAYALYKCEKCDSSVIKRKLPLTEHIDENDDMKCDICKANCCRHPLVYRVTTPKHEATCVENGYTEGEYCSRCGYTFKEPVVIKSTGHVDSDSDGVCDNCGKRTSYIKALADRFMNLFKKISERLSRLFGKKNNH